MIPTGFQECNTVLVPSPGTEDKVSNLPIYRSPGRFTLSVWELDAKELEAIQKTGKLFIGICAGGITQPPIFAGVYAPGVVEQLELIF